VLRVTRRNLGLILVAIACLAAMGAVAVAHPLGLFTTKGAYSFVSAPTLHPPILKTDTKPDRRRLAPGDWFLTNEQSSAYNRPMIGEGGPMILDRNLQPVWFSGVGTHQVAANLKLQTYNGKPALSWWQGVVSRTGITKKGTLVVLDQSYRSIAKIVAPSPWVISLHDAVVQGTDVWVTAYRSVPNQNLKPYGGASKATVYDAAFQKYDLTTGKLVSTWDALTHVPLSSSYASVIKNTPWDAYHINSLELVGSSEMLVSMRNTWAAYLVNLATGNTIWTLGGKHSSFTPKTPFRFQHDVELHGSDVVSAFDDNCCNQTGPGTFQAPFGPASGVATRCRRSRSTPTSR